jgi:hypothetical protein
MSYSIRFDIASSLQDTIGFSGYKANMKKVKLGEKDAWRVAADEVITVDVFTPGNIVVYTTGKKKTFNSEFRAKTYILSEILEQ